MANFTENVKILIDVVTKNGANELKNMRTELQNTEGAFAKTKVAAGGFGDFVKSNMGAAVTAGVAGAGTAVAAFAVKAAGDFQNLALQVDNFKQKTGLAANEASRWVEVAKDLSVDTDTLATAFGRVAREDASGALAKYGLTATDTSGRFEELLTKIGEIPDENERAAAAFQVFGKSWQALSPLLDGTEDLKKRLDEVSGGQLISDKQIGEARDFRDNLDDLNDKLDTFTVWVGEKAVAAVNSLIDAANSIGGPFADLADKIQEADDSSGGLLSSIADVGGTIANEYLNPVTQAQHLSDAWGASVDALTTGFGLWGDEADDTGGSIATLGSTIRSAQIDEKQLAIETEKAKQAQKDAAAAAADYNQILEHTDQALEKMAAALRDASKAQEDQISAQRAAADATVAVSKATDELTTFQAGLKKETAEAKGNQEKLNDINREAVDKASGLADAVVELHTQQSAANGTTITATEKFDQWGHAMIDAAGKLSGPVQGAVVGYIGSVNDIPPDKLTEIQALIEQGKLDEAKAKLDEASEARKAAIIADANTAEAEKDLNYAARDRQARVFLKTVGPGGEVAGGYAKGGYVRAALGGARSGLVLVGEQGPELVDLPSGSYVYTASRTRGMVSDLNSPEAGSLYSGRGVADYAGYRASRGEGWRGIDTGHVLTSQYNYRDAQGNTMWTVPVIDAMSKLADVVRDPLNRSTIIINMPPGSDGEDVVAALKKYERRNGGIPVRFKG